MTPEEERKKKAVARQTRYYQKNKGEINKYKVEWRKKNPLDRERANAERRKYYAGRKKRDPQFLADCAMKQRARLEKSPEQREKARNKAREYRAKYPEKTRQNVKNHHYRAKYGITIAERDQLFEAQEKRCRICRSDSSGARGFAVDHCHKTKRVRGILCRSCNLVLGHVKDDIAILAAAIAYLKGELV